MAGSKWLGEAQQKVTGVSHKYQQLPRTLVRALVMMPDDVDCFDLCSCLLIMEA